MKLFKKNKQQTSTKQIAYDSMVNTVNITLDLICHDVMPLAEKNLRYVMTCN